MILGDSITGEAREVAKVMAAMAREIRAHGAPFKPPVALISGGECTVTVRGKGGRGGRCSEFLLSLALELGRHRRTSTRSPPTPTASTARKTTRARCSLRTRWRARRRKDWTRGNCSRGNDSYGFFGALGDLVVTGPTRTNVNDYRAILIA